MFLNPGSAALSKRADGRNTVAVLEDGTIRIFDIDTGDVLYHGPRNPMKADYNPAGLVARINSCPVPVVIAQGNCDSSVDASCIELPIEAPYAYVVWEGLRIVVTHGDAVMSDAEKDAMAKHL